MRTFNDQIKDVAQGRLSPAQVIAEGVGHYAIDYFSFYAAGWDPSPAELAALEAIREAYRAARGNIVRQEIRHEAQTSSPTQLWEPCERCGQEPSYITVRGNLCQSCAGKMGGAL